MTTIWRTYSREVEDNRPWEEKHSKEETDNPSQDTTGIEHKTGSRAGGPGVSEGSAVSSVERKSVKTMANNGGYSEKEHRLLGIWEARKERF